MDIDTTQIDRFINLAKNEFGRDRGWRQRMKETRTGKRLVGQIFRKVGGLHQGRDEALRSGDVVSAELLAAQARNLIDFPHQLAGGLTYGERNVRLRQVLRA